MLLCGAGAAATATGAPAQWPEAATEPGIGREHTGAEAQPPQPAAGRLLTDRQAGC